MTSEQAREEPGALTHQRVALRRLRTFGTVFLVFGLLGVVAGIAIVTTGTVVWVGLIMSAMWLCFAALGVVMLVRYRQQLAALESRLATGAGEE